MALLSLNDVSIGFGGPPVIEHINLQIEESERIGLLGRNGAGKSTLLKLVNSDLNPDEGRIIRSQNIRIARLNQEVPQNLQGRIEDIVRAGLEGIENLPPEWDADGGWRREFQVEQVLERLELKPNLEFGLLSAGNKRQVMLARCLVSEPHILLLDEPTNHLDIEAIRRLENFLSILNSSLLFVTHDRMFLQNLSTRIIELERGRLLDWACDYPTFLKRKQTILSAELEQQTQFDKKLAQEEAWIRQGIEARRTRNEGRVRALERLRKIRQERRERPRKARMQIQESERSGDLVIDVEHVSFQYAERPVLKDFSTTILRGERVGIIGPNGSGKTTLLRILLGELPPDRGSVRHGTNLEIAYFDQLRGQLNEDESVLDNVGQGSDTITINGKPRNLIGYLRDFLFEPERARAPIHMLSGGERNRLLLARLFARPANLLVLDEPTNDLDLETLELLEDLIMEYSGTLLIVSHDRTFLNNLTTSVLSLEGNAQVEEYNGGYDDWLKHQKDNRVTNPQKENSRSPKTTAGHNGRATQMSRERSSKLSYNERRTLQLQKQELEQVPERIEKLEAELHRLQTEMASSSFYQQDEAAIIQSTERMKSLEDSLETAYKRWQELEKIMEEMSL